MNRNFDFGTPRIPKKFIAFGALAFVLNLAYIVGIICLIAYLVKWVIS
jgi:hypothetical protein